MTTRRGREAPPMIPTAARVCYNEGKPDRQIPLTRSEIAHRPCTHVSRMGVESLAMRDA